MPTAQFWFLYPTSLWTIQPLTLHLHPPPIRGRFLKPRKRVSGSPRYHTSKRHTGERASLLPPLPHRCQISVVKISSLMGQFPKNMNRSKLKEHLIYYAKKLLAIDFCVPRATYWPDCSLIFFCIFFYFLPFLVNHYEICVYWLNFALRAPVTETKSSSTLSCQLRALTYVYTVQYVYCSSVL